MVKNDNNEEYNEIARNHWTTSSKTLSRGGWGVRELEGTLY